MSALTRVNYQGRTLDRATLAAVHQVEMILHYGIGSLTVVQGSYTGGRVSASAGTHNGAGAVDGTPARHAEKVAAMRFVGFAAWHRTFIPKVWIEHVHAILNCPQIYSHIAPLARTQIAMAKQRRTGLSGEKFDPRYPALTHSFHYDEREVSLTRMKALAHAGGAAKKGTTDRTHIDRLRAGLRAEKVAVVALPGRFPKAAWKRWQKKLGYEQNGIPGPKSLIRLGHLSESFMATP